MANEYLETKNPPLQMAKILATLAGTVVLASCGGGGGAPVATVSPTPSTPITTTVMITGTAAKGMALANAAIVAKCADGRSYNTVSSATGGYSLAVPSTAVPCLIQATSGTDSTVWRSVSVSGGTTAITPLTEMVVAKVLMTVTGDAFTSFPNAAAVAALTSANVATAQTDVRIALNGVSDLTVIPDFIASSFKAATSTTVGDAIDQALDALTAALKAKGSSVQAVANALVNGKAVSTTFTVQPLILRLNDTGILPSQCSKIGSDNLVACSSSDATALGAGQDGMTGLDRNITTNSNSDGLLGFSFSSTTGGCVLDNVSGLTWEVKTTDNGLRDWRKTYTNYFGSDTNSDPFGSSSLFGTSGDASGFVKAVNSSNLCGFSDWRLPSAVELQSIVSYGVAYPGPTIETSFFPNTQGGIYWTGAKVAGNSQPWVVDFGFGYVRFGFDSLSNSNHYVRLVRGKVNYPQPRYSVSSNGQEVKDHQTNLIWKRCQEGMSWNGNTCVGVPIKVTYWAALQYAASQIGGNLWRIPNVKELFSIVAMESKSPAVDFTAFPGTTIDSVWSSTPNGSGFYSGTTQQFFGSWFTYFDLGNTEAIPGGNLYTVRLVRDSQ